MVEWSNAAVGMPTKRKLWRNEGGGVSGFNLLWLQGRKDTKARGQQGQQKRLQLYLVGQRSGRLLLEVVVQFHKTIRHASDSKCMCLDPARKTTV